MMNKRNVDDDERVALTCVAFARVDVGLGAIVIRSSHEDGWERPE